MTTNAIAKALRPNIRALSDQRLTTLVGELAATTKRDQSILASARQELRRRTKAKRALQQEGNTP